MALAIVHLPGLLPGGIKPFWGGMRATGRVESEAEEAEEAGGGEKGRASRKNGDKTSRAA